MVEIKICGIKSKEIGNFAIQSGANYVGIVIGTPSSPRNVPYDKAIALVDALKAKTNVVLITKILNSELIQHLPTLNANYLQFHHVSLLNLINLAHDDFGGNLIFGITPKMEDRFLEELSRYFKEGDMILIDESEGKGIQSDEDLLFTFLDKIKKYFGKDMEDVFFAGGFNPKNVKEFLSKFHPKGIDVSSGVESKPGEKNKTLIQRFCKSVKKYTI
ncbi:MAG: hypothetical protein ACFFCS_07945 [Candidatus Hodarchaeota archaeon]